jgi:hypothetical protein
VEGLHNDAVQVPHAPLAVQDWWPGVQVPEQLPQTPIGSHDCVKVVFPAQAPAAHWQAGAQVSVSTPQPPQATVRVVDGAQTPWFEQAPSLHWQVAAQVSISVPQLPQESDRVEPAAHIPCPTHEPIDH